MRYAAMLGAVVAGVGVAKLFDVTDLDTSTSYTLCVTALLGFGLYASTSGIRIAEFKSQLRTVLIAVTLGVLAKAAMIFGAMYLLFRDPHHVILAIAVAQIDPLSVAAVRSKTHMSESAKTLLAAWASFDDPITVLLTVYVTAFALHAQDSAAGGDVLGIGLSTFVQNLFWNLLLAGVVYLAWRAMRTLSQRDSTREPSANLANMRQPLTRYAIRGVALLALLAVAVVAVWFSLLLALAIIGLFLRPRPSRRLDLDRLTQVVVLIATFAVGLVLVVDSVALLGKGAVLGVAAYGAQIVIALVLTIPRMWQGDRVRLAFGQQNGMTAIVLALMLEPTLPNTITIVASAIVVVNVLHALCNALWDRLHPPEPEPNPDLDSDLDPGPQVYQTVSVHPAPTNAPMNAEPAG